MDFNYGLKRQLELLISKEQTLLKKESLELKSLPRGDLVVRHRNNKVYYTCRTSNKEHGITRNKDLVYKLARKSYLLKSIKLRNTNIKSLKMCLISISSYENSLFKSAAIECVPNANKSSDSLFWLKSQTSQNQFNAENLKYRTKSGIMVRSKSERIICDRLFHYGITFKYEPAMNILGKEYYPDFVILRPDGDMVIWEHNGLMDNEEYRARAHKKIDLYSAAGYYQHRNLICTQESDILDDGLLDEIILRFIL